MPAVLPVPLSVPGGDVSGDHVPGHGLSLPLPGPGGLGPGAAQGRAVLALRLRRGHADTAHEEPPPSRLVLLG